VPKALPSVLGISFDGLAISGIVNEFLNVADVLRHHHLRVLFDVGYDITMGRTKDFGPAYFPPWVKLLRSIGDLRPQGYFPELIRDVVARVNRGTPVAAAEEYAGVCSQLVSALVATFERENVRLIVVENGTLPDNPLFTEAVYLAIGEYGARRGFEKYVLWRDHDLMWSAEPHLYGSYPYPGVRKPGAGPYIHYAVATEWMRLRMRAWAPSAEYHVVPNRFFRPSPRKTPGRLRSAYGIPEDAYLIARCTRVVPQKCIERDLRLLDELQRRLAASGDRRKVFLLVTGPTKEDLQEFERLAAIESRLSVAGQVVWGDGLLPFNPALIGESNRDRFSVHDLLSEADLSSFLTCYDYEGFGNPPGESMAMGVPFIATTYELYHEVYGSKGAIAPLLSIDRSSTAGDPIPEFFVEWTLRALTDPEYRAQISRRNLEICERFYSLSALERQTAGLFRDVVAG
jgi:glycosyltransferase involved in cell wall biosynthesis